MPGFRRIILTLTFVSSLSAVLVACNNPETWTFKEEVQLNTGRTVVVTRTAQRNNVWPRLGSGGYQSVINESLIQRELSVDWEAKNHGGTPFSLGIISGDLYIATFVTQDLAYCVSHPQKYVVRFWKQSSKGWEVIEQTDTLLDQLTANLMRELEWSDGSDAKPGYLGLKEKEIRSAQNFTSPPSVRRTLEATLGGRCEDVLRAANLLPLKTSMPRPPSSADSGPVVSR